MKTVYFTILFISLIRITFTQKTKIPLMEKIYGATTANAVIGNQSLTVGISKYGELVGLRWPSANFSDQLNYKSLYPIPPGWTVEKYNRIHNARTSDGVFAGLFYTDCGKPVETYFRDEDWETKQSYYSENTPILITVHTNKTLGFEVTNTDYCAKNGDVLVRNYKIKILSKENWKNLTNFQFIHHASIALCTNRPDFKPDMDWVDDSKNGYCSFYDSKLNQFVSFIPEVKEERFLPKGKLDATEINQFNKDLDQLFISSWTKEKGYLNTKSVFFALSSNIEPTSYSVYNEENKNNLSLFLNSEAIYESYYKIDVNSENLSFDFFFSFAPTHSLNQSQLEKAKTSRDIIFKETIDFWENKISKANLPFVPSDEMRITLKRTLINILLSSHPESGGLSSSNASHQPSYVQIWPRDAAFMGLALDCAGFHEEAEKNLLFLAKVQRKKDGESCRQPEKGECYAGTWFHCFYPDGRPSWYYDMEIDQVGFALWGFYSHSQFLTTEKQKEFLNKVKENIHLAADFLVWFKDPNGLQKRATEDDLLWKSQTILGASSVILGLKSAVSSLKIIDSTDAAIVKYEARIKELSLAIEKFYWKEKTRQFQKAVYGNFGPRAVITFPAMFYSIDNQRLIDHQNALNAQIQPFFEKSKSAVNKEWWYLGKTTLSLAYLSNQNPEFKVLSEKYLKILLEDVCTQDTRVYGETPFVKEELIMVNNKKTIQRVYHNRVGQPCNIAGAYIYLSAEMHYGNALRKVEF